MGNLGTAYFLQMDYTRTIKYQQQNLAIAKAIHDQQGEEQALSNIGMAYYALGDYTKAIDYLQQRLAIGKAIHDQQGEEQALGNLGTAYTALEDYTRAIDYLQQSLTIAKAINNRQGEDSALGKLGGAYLALGDYTKAIDHLQQSLTIAKAINNRQGEDSALGNLGVAYHELGDYSQAIDYLQQRLAIAKAIYDRQGEATALGNLANVYQELENYTRAIDYRQQSLAIAKDIHDRKGEGANLGNLGTAYLLQRDYTKAIDYIQQSIAIAKAIHDRQGEGSALDQLGGAYLALGDYTKAIDYMQQSIAIAKAIKNRQDEGFALNNLGVILAKQGSFAAADKNFRDGIEVWKQIRKLLGNNDAFKVSIFEEQVRSYTGLQQVLIDENQPLAALEVAEAGRARAFVDLLARVTSSNSNLTATVLELTLEQMQQIANTQHATLVEYSIIYDDFRLADQTTSKASKLYIWVISPDKNKVEFVAVDLKPLSSEQNTTLSELINNVRCFDNANCLQDTHTASANENIRKLSRGEFNTSAEIAQFKPTSSTRSNKQLQQLHQLLIKPIAHLLPKNPDDRVIFIPQRELFLVPFPALQDANNQYLIQQHTILTAPSIQTLDFTQNIKRRVQQAGLQNSLVAGVPRRKTTIVGNPLMPTVPPDQQPLPALKGAEEEAKQVAQLLNSSALVGDKATKAAVVSLMPNSRIIHLATHGIMDENRGIGSAIALAPTTKDNGLLTAEDILNLKLNADLVVLSACNTGRGRITGDGVIGLSRSFISAGVPSIIVSLWSIPDSPTAFLMKRFYQTWQQDSHHDKAKALRQAMLDTMAKHPDPKDWAAFTLIGEAE